MVPAAVSTSCTEAPARLSALGVFAGFRVLLDVPRWWRDGLPLSRGTLPTPTKRPESCPPSHSCIHDISRLWISQWRGHDARMPPAPYDIMLRYRWSRAALHHVWLVTCTPWRHSRRAGVHSSSGHITGHPRHHLQVAVPVHHMVYVHGLTLWVLSAGSTRVGISAHVYMAWCEHWECSLRFCMGKPDTWMSQRRYPNSKAALAHTA